MKILILQLARLGDIYQTWPAIRGLRRKYPFATIEVLTRRRYQGAFDGLEAINRRRILPTEEILSPLLADTMDVKTAHSVISEFTDNLARENYDLILNYSFSPLSSYLTHALSYEHTKVCGYSRTNDGYLAIPDDMSAYFYAQVGVNKPNRFHLAEIFGTMAELDLVEEDWAPPQDMVANAQSPEVLIHVGASENKKQIHPAKWASIITQFLKIHDGSIGLIGAGGETKLAEEILSSISDTRVQNFVGKTKLTELFALIAGAKLAVGADSAPMHMASLVRTPCVNLSVTSVNFWETGPRAPGSYVLRGQDETDFVSDKVAMVMKRSLLKEKQDLSVIPVQTGTPSYWALTPKEAEFQWNFIRALYMGEDFPAGEEPIFRDGIIKMADINSLMMDQITAIQKGADLQKLAPIIDRGEEIIETIGKLVPSMSGLVRWYQTEKIRIGPGDQTTLLEKSLMAQTNLQKVLALYLESYGLTMKDVHEITAEEAAPKEAL